MTNSSVPPPHIVILGGGLAGLAAAEAVVSQGDPAAPPQVTVLEAAERFGGIIETVYDDGWLVERAADTFLTARPEGLDLVHRLGLDDALVSVSPSARRALVWSPAARGGGGRLVPVPAGFRLLAPGRPAALLKTPLLSWPGRVRAALEQCVPPRQGPGTDESLEAFAVRRLGREAFDRLVQPLVSGIWTADPARLSMAAACPDFLALERKHGSLTRGEKHRLRTAGLNADASGARYGQFVSFQRGMQTLIDGLVARLRARGVELVCDRVETLHREAAGWNVGVAGGPPLSASAVVVALPAPVASRLLAPAAPELATELAGIEYSGAAIVSLGFDRADVEHPLDAAGMIVPRIAGRRLLAASFSSTKFPRRAPADAVLIRGFLGGALDPTAAERSDHEISQQVLADLRDILGIRGEPRYGRIDRWHAAMPQYNLGHVDRIKRIRAAESRLPGLALAGAAYEGVGIPQVIAAGQQAMERAVGSQQPEPRRSRCR